MSNPQHHGFAALNLGNGWFQPSSTSPNTTTTPGTRKTPSGQYPGRIMLPDPRPREPWHPAEPRAVVHIPHHYLGPATYTFQIEHLHCDGAPSPPPPLPQHHGLEIQTRTRSRWIHLIEARAAPHVLHRSPEAAGRFSSSGTRHRRSLSTTTLRGGTEGYGCWKVTAKRC
ncbi:hypothetical protein BU16DRAFT_282325 [Lophium mytilinum]|uniref:Uncharacterized protein n=1 Tax=Lophium mytilinum TaxID=390894 RepID=A0A6A6R5X6_9PEZI|nr:hypothetical protein BU16DRAFT_282325 [Lophium mytilinum]